MASKLQGIPVSPLTGNLDTRSLPNELAKGSMRWRQCFKTTEQGKLCRHGGFEKLLNQSPYNNQDLHDQLRTFTSGLPRQPITFTAEIESSRKVRYLFAGTGDTLYKLNEFSGNWKMLGTGYGNGSVSANDYHFKHAVLGDYAIFTNGYTKVLYHGLEENPDPNPPLNTIPDLDLIGVTRAGVVWEWKNCIFLADLDMDGERAAFRFIWSDYNNPISFDPSVVSSITGLQDLDFRERILGGKPAGNNFLIYTTHAIWELSVTGGANSFAVRKVFDTDQDQSMCLFYPNTLISLGDAHMYMGKDKIYVYSQYYQRPEPVEWVHQASGELYKNIDSNACNSHVAVYKDKEAFFSVAKVGDANNCPSQTLRLQMQYKTADYLDFGSTAFAVYRPGQFQTIRDFFIEEGICSLTTLTADGYGYVNEGLPSPIPTPAPAFFPDCIYTKTPLTVGGVTTEDYTKGSADSTSLCALLGNLRFDDICRKCDPLNILVMASSADWSLKQFTDVLYRERCTNVTAVGTTGSFGYSSSVGTYVLDGVTSILRPSPAFAAEMLLNMNYFRVDYAAAFQSTPNKIQFRVGSSAQIADPNTDDCCLVWLVLSQKDLKCLSPSTSAEHLLKGTIPFQELRWTFEREGRFIYTELKMTGTGGAACFSGVEANITQIPIKNC